MASEPISQQSVAILRSVGGLVFDATFEEQHESTLEITDNPVETGVTISDHAYMSPLRLVISAGVSDTTLSTRSNDSFAAGESRSRTAYKMLIDLQAKAEPFNVQTGLKLYKNMVVKSIRTSQDKDSSNALLFTAELREIIIAKTEIVTYTPRQKGSTTQQASKTKAKGEQQGKEPAAKQTKKSVAKALTDSFSSWRDKGAGK